MNDFINDYDDSNLDFDPDFEAMFAMDQARKQPIFIQAIRKEYNTYTIKAGNTIIEKNITKTGAQLSIECLCDGYVNDGYTISDYTSLCFTASK